MKPAGFTGPVTALGYTRSNVLISGSGAFLSTPSSRVYVEFTVLGVRAESDTIVAWGGCHCAVLCLEGKLLTLWKRVPCRQWVRDARTVGNCELAIAYAYGTIDVVDLRDEQVVERLQGPAAGLLYSCELHGSDRQSLRLVCGTVMKTVLVWSARGTIRLDGHRGAVHRVRVHHAGTLALSAADDRSVRLWNIESGSCVRTLLGHSARVWDVAFLHSECLVASVSEDCTLRLWRNEDCVRVLSVHSGKNVWSLAVNSDASVLATGGQDALIVQVHIREVLRQREVSRTFRGERRNRLDFLLGKDEEVTAITCNRERVFTGTNKGKVIVCCHSSAEILRTAEFPAAISAMSCVDFDLVLGDSRGAVVFADTPTLTIYTEQLISPLRITDIFPLRERSWLLANPKGQATIWTDMEVQHTLEVSVRVFSAAVVGDSLALGDALGTLYLYSIADWRLLCRIPYLHARCRLTDIATSAGLMYTAGRDGKVNRFTVSSEGVEHIGSKDSAGRCAVERFSATSQIALVFLKSSVTLYDCLSDTELLTSTCLGAGLPYIWRVEGSRVRVYYSLRRGIEGFEGTVTECDGSPPAQLSYLGTRSHGREVLCAVCVAGYLVTGGEDCLIKAFKLPDMRCVDTVPGHPCSVRGIASSGNYVVSAGGKMAVFLWQALSTPELHLAKLSSLRLPGDLEQRVMCIDIVGEWVATGDSGGSLSLLSLREMPAGALLELRTALPGDAVVLCLKLFSTREGVYAASGTTSGRVRVHRVPTGEALFDLKAHQLGVDCLVLWRPCEDTVLIVSGGDDQSLVRTEFSAAESKVAKFDNAHDSAVKALALHGDTVISASWDGLVRVWSRATLTLQSTQSHHVGDCSALSIHSSLLFLVGSGIEWFQLSDKTV